MNDFILKQQELAREKLIQGMPDGFANLSETEVNELIAQIITNTREELLRLAEGEKVDEDLINKRGWHKRNSQWIMGINEGIDTIKQHITSLTKAK